MNRRAKDGTVAVTSPKEGGRCQHHWTVSRESMTVGPTAQDKGLRLTIEVMANDNGMIHVDGVPINGSPN